MNKEQLEILNTYAKAGISSILLENIPENLFKNSIVLDANCDISLLNGHYEGTEFVAPSWYNELIEISKVAHAILVIKNINTISKEEQTKFIELLKYRKISTFDLPKNCTIVGTCFNLKENQINEEVYSLMAHIQDK